MTGLLIVKKLIFKELEKYKATSEFSKGSTELRTSHIR